MCGNRLTHHLFACHKEWRMNYIFWLIGVIVVVLVVLGFLGLR